MSNHVQASDVFLHSVFHLCDMIDGLMDAGAWSEVAFV